MARTVDAHRGRLLLLLDRACADKTMGKRDREKLADVICSTALDFMTRWRRSSGRRSSSLRADIAALRANVQHVEVDFDVFSDIKKLKAWLKNYRIVANDPGYGEPWF